MRNKIIAFIFFVLFLVVGYKFYVLQDYTDTLLVENKKKDDLISQSAKVDSIIIEKTKEYVKTIHEYKDATTFTRDGEQVSSSQLVTEFNNLLIKNNRLTDSLNYCRKQNKISSLSSEMERLKIADSLSNLNWVLQVLENKYGFKYSINKNQKGTTITHKASTIDSALVLFPYYRHTLTLENKTWTIETDKTYRKQQRKVDKEKENK